MYQAMKLRLDEKWADELNKFIERRWRNLIVKFLERWYGIYISSSLVGRFNAEQFKS